jgi:hypothetical protein
MANGITKGSTIGSSRGTPLRDMARGVRRRARLGGLLNFYERAA